MSTDLEYTVILSTVPDVEKGADLAKSLVEHKLAACVNIVPGIRSIYMWKGKVEDDSEALMIIKSRRDYIQKIVTLLEKMHPYDTPEIIGLPIIEGNKDYLDWVGSVTDSNPDVEELR